MNILMIPQTCEQIYRLWDMTSVLEKDVIIQKFLQGGTQPSAIQSKGGITCRKRSKTEP